MQWRRYKVEVENSKPFIGYLYHKRPGHVYFSEKTPIEVDSDVLDEIEAKILNSVANKEYECIEKANEEYQEEKEEER